jgi:multidrug resistance efflux pump
VIRYVPGMLSSRGIVWLGAILIVAPLSAQELPTNPNPEAALDFEPQLMLQDIPDLPAIEVTSEPDAQDAVEKAKRRLEQARNKQARWQKLAKQGVLSRAEAESCAVEVARALVRHEQARCDLLRLQLEGIRKRAGTEGANASLEETAEASWKQAVELAAEAAKKLQETEKEAAEVNLHRHRRLHSAGLVSKRQLQRAEAAVLKFQTADSTK